MDVDLRISRKRAHINAAVTLESGPASSGFEDVQFVHNCLPEIRWDDVSLRSSIGNVVIENPVIINAMTGGSKDLEAINRALAIAARNYNLAMAVGSQTAALEDEAARSSFKVVRKEMPCGVVIANLPASAGIEAAKRAVEMLQADLIQLHLNAVQEIWMSEGDRDYSGWLNSIESICSKIGIPVIVKEVGFGISRDEAKLLRDAGVKVIDISGSGGTNFLAVEAWRNGISVSDEMLRWGIPTVASLIEVLDAVGTDVDVVASGGVRGGIQAAKALALGASAVGVAGPFIRALIQGGQEALEAEIESTLTELKKVMIMLGARNLDQLAQMPLVITGRMLEWLRLRGVDVQSYALRARR